MLLLASTLAHSEIALAQSNDVVTFNFNAQSKEKDSIKSSLGDVIPIYFNIGNSTNDWIYASYIRCDQFPDGIRLIEPPTIDPETKSNSNLTIPASITQPTENNQYYTFTLDELISKGKDINIGAKIKVTEEDNDVVKPLKCWLGYYLYDSKVQEYGDIIPSQTKNVFITIKQDTWDKVMIFLKNNTAILPVISIVLSILALYIARRTQKVEIKQPISIKITEQKPEARSLNRTQRKKQKSPNAKQNKN